MFYRIALLANVEPLESNAAWRCYEDLKMAGHAVEILDPTLYPGLVDDEGCIDYSRLSKFNEVFKPDCITLGNESAEEIIASLENKSCCGSEHLARHFLIYGYVGKDNFGDELIFHILCTRLKRRFPGSYVTLIGHGPVNALSRHGVASVPRSVGAKASYSMNGASGLLFMAGLMFDTGFTLHGSGLIDIFQSQRGITILAALTQLAYLNDVPVAYVGIGAGPIDTIEAQKHIKLASLTQPRYITRDKTTTSLLLQAGVDPSLVTEKADLAFLAEKPALSQETQDWLAENKLEQSKYILVALRDCAGLAFTLRREVAAALDCVYERYGMRTVFMNFAPEDDAIHHEVSDLMRHFESTVFFGDADDFDRVLELISASRMVLAMRLHGSILANAFGVPSVGLDYNDKIAAYYQKMDRAECALPLTCNADELMQAISAIEGDYKAAVGEIIDKAHESRVLAEEAMSELYSLIDAADPCPAKQRLYRTIHSDEALLARRANERADKSETECKQALRELKQVRSEHGKACRELQRMKDSTTWKVGRVVTAIPRAFKRALRRTR